MQESAIELGEGEIHVWEVDPEGLTAAERLARYAAWLSPDEEARRQRFIFERHRHAFLIARALVRGTLTRYAPVIEPAAWRFSIGAHGRPEIEAAQAAAHGLEGLRFNLSHTDGRAVLALARGEIGVDVEARRRRGNLRGIADHFFAAPEVAALEGLEGEALARRFFDYWTLKEAYIKARGIGISLGLDRFWFEVGAPGAAIRIDFAPDLEDDPASWSFRRFDLGEAHPVALALRRPPAAGLAVRLWSGLPGDPVDDAPATIE
ncbi:MAG: 4'-phosphopantetheinyl transferase superfamily protein [Myxococcales bacterium]|nr:4'-phosphopantetheinyl transferase superfamily protein [Myxococcales bacterium]